jgi:arylsulfatase A-like enzyme
MTSRPFKVSLCRLLVGISFAFAVAINIHMFVSEEFVYGKSAALRFGLFLFWTFLFFHTALRLLRKALAEALDAPEDDSRLESLHLLFMPGLLWLVYYGLAQNQPTARMFGAILPFLSLAPIALFVALLFHQFRGEFRRNLFANPDRLLGLKWGARSLLPLAIILAGVSTDVALVKTTALYRIATNRNVVLISIDALRPDYLGCYGASYGVSPSINKLASEGVLFERVYSTAPCTLPAHMTMMTGLFPTEHGMAQKDPVKLICLDEDIITLAELLRFGHYKTAGFADGGYVSPNFGFHRGFDYYWPNYLYLVNPPGVTIDKATAFLKDLDERRAFFIFVHTYAVHDYFCDAGGVEMIEERPGAMKQAYRERLALTDAKLSKLIETMKNRGFDRNTLTILLSDHGEAFGEHGLFGHTNSVYEELLRIPLIMKGPLLPSGERVLFPVSLIDIMPTILDWTGIDFENRLPGESLMAIWDRPGKENTNRLIFAEQQRSFYTTINGRYKYIEYPETGQKYLFDIFADPNETIDLAQREPEALIHQKTMQKKFMEKLSFREGAQQDMPADLRRQLRALGYID